MAKKTGRYGCGPLGNWVLNNPDYAPYFAWARKYYDVQPADVHSWWDLSEIERIMFEVNLEEHQLDFHLHYRDLDLPKEIVIEKLWKVYPIYGFEFGTKKYETDRTLRLPPELIARVTAFTKKCKLDGMTRPDEQGFNTFNDWIRYALSQGML